MPALTVYEQYLNECDRENSQPPRFNTCEACEGYGTIPKRVWVHEHGCGFGHYDTDEVTCTECNGSGWTEE